MTPSETIRLQALKLKELNHRGSSHPGLLMDSMLAQNAEIKSSLRNICALISPELFQRVENLCDLLELSKREFVEDALVEFCKLTESIVAEVDPFVHEDFVPDVAAVPAPLAIGSKE
jgi:hypothetical protein